MLPMTHQQELEFLGAYLQAIYNQSMAEDQLGVTSCRNFGFGNKVQ